MFQFFQRRRQHFLLDSEEGSGSFSVIEGEGSKKIRRGSTIGRVHIDRDRKTGHENLMRNYFLSTPKFPHKFFRRRFRMSRDLFVRIHDVVVDYDEYFVQSRNAARVEGLSSLQKVVASLRMLCYGVSGDMVDEYIRVAESTSTEAMKRFVEAVIHIFGDHYLRSPTPNDVDMLLRLHEERGFPGMLGSIDCSLNDINVLERSPVFADVINGRAPPVNFMVNNHQYDTGYYLADGIYPKWSTIVKTITMPQTQKPQNFAKAQESARKDVERAFGVLQSRFHIISQPCRYFKVATMKNIMKACVIMHNMIVEDERDLYKSLEGGNYYLFEDISNPMIERGYEHFDYNQFIVGREKLKDKTQHHRLQEDLVEHLWEMHRNVM